MSDTTTTRTEKVRLTGWGTFDELGRSIKALLFGEMVKRATPVVEQYHSDLFHDALWINETVTGPTTIDFLVRTSGTNTGLAGVVPNSAVIGVEIGAPGGVFYEIELVTENGMWSAIFTQIPLTEVGKV